ncbi:MAG: hypothetical protein HY359_13190 [Candidatus Rokubacteria bacterium]|nr:hypothetical protein [Candidatus Rokubacteria bacterium]
MWGRRPSKARFLPECSAPRADAARAATGPRGARRTRGAGVETGPPRVGKYGVDVDALKRVGIPAIREAVAAGRLVVVDEIGKMGMASPA